MRAAAGRASSRCELDGLLRALVTAIVAIAVCLTAVRLIDGWRWKRDVRLQNGRTVERHRAFGVAETTRPCSVFCTQPFLASFV